MTVELSREDEQLLAKRLRSGVFSSVQEVIHRALQTQDCEEAWLESHKAAIEEAIDCGLEQTERGEILSPDEVRTRMAEGKALWRARQERESA